MRAIGIILAGGNNESLGELTSSRATSAMPVASGYRAIDFSLSNMSNSGISKVAVITQYNSRSLRDHLSSSKWWDFGRKLGGLFIFSPSLTSDGSIWYRGTADSIYQNLTYLKRSNEKYVVIAGGNGIYKMDYRKMIAYHVEKGSDITIACKTGCDWDKTKFGVMSVEESGKVLDFEEKPLQTDFDVISLGIYVMERTLLIKLLESSIAEKRFDFVRDILVYYKKVLNIYAYRFEGYWNALTSTKSYYNINMDFLKEDVRELFFKQYPLILTKPKDQPAAKYNIGAVVKNAIVGSGAIINGSIENSVIFRKVYIGDNASIKNSIIMEDSFIGNNCVIENAIIDKEVIISDGKHVGNVSDELLIIGKGTVM